MIYQVFYILLIIGLKWAHCATTRDNLSSPIQITATIPNIDQNAPTPLFLVGDLDLDTDLDFVVFVNLMINQGGGGSVAGVVQLYMMRTTGLTSSVMDTAYNMTINGKVTTSFVNAKLDDMNGDGLLDIVYLGTTNANATVFIYAPNSGTVLNGPSFGPATVPGNLQPLSSDATELVSNACNTAISVDTVDITSDGTKDVIGTCLNAGVTVFQVWLNRHLLGLWTNAVTIPSGVGSIRSVIAHAFTDVDADGFVDIVMLTFNSFTSIIDVLVRLQSPNSGNAALNVPPTFASATSVWSKVVIPATITATTSLLAADMDADGLVDLVLSYGNDLHFLKNNYTNPGTFILSSSLPHGLGDISLVGPYIADMDADGFMDVVFGRITTNNNNGNGTFVRYDPLVADMAATASLNSGPGTATTPQRIIIEDFNADGLLDMFTYNQERPKVVINGADNYVSVARPMADYGGANTVGAVQFGDLNNDTFKDVVVSYQDNSSPPNVILNVFRNIGHGTMSTVANLTRPNTFECLEMCIVRATGGTFNDIIALFQSAPSGGFVIAYVSQTSEFTFGSFVSVYTDTSPTYTPVSMKCKDLNNDGWPDLMISVRKNGDNTGQIYWLRNTQVGFTYPPVSLIGQLPSAPMNLFLSDWTGDGTLDLVMPLPSTNEVRLAVGIINFNVYQLTNLQAIGLSRSDCGLNGWASATMGDMNHDGNLDFVVLCSNPPNLLLYYGAYNGSFSLQSTTAVSTSIQPVGPSNTINGNQIVGTSRILVRDFDANGYRDVLTLSRYAGLTCVMHSYSFTPTDTDWSPKSLVQFTGFQNTVNVQDFLVFDVDMDGDLDVVVATSTGVNIYLQKGNNVKIVTDVMSDTSCRKAISNKTKFVPCFSTMTPLPRIPSFTPSRYILAAGATYSFSMPLLIQSFKPFVMQSGTPVAVDDEFGRNTSTAVIHPATVDCSSFFLSRMLPFVDFAASLDTSDRLEYVGCLTFVSQVAFLSNIVIQGRIGGPGILISASNIAMNQISIRNHSTMKRGAGLYIVNYSRVHIHYSSFSQNLAAGTGGSAINLIQSQLSIWSSKIDSNGQTKLPALTDGSSSNVSSTASGSQGGGILISAADDAFDLDYSIMSVAWMPLQLESVTLWLVGTQFQNNTADYGGALSLVGSQLSTYPRILIEACNFQRNFASRLGGAIYTFLYQNDILTTAFQSNQASSAGGALYFSNSRSTLTKSSFMNNTVLQWGGALYQSGGETDIYFCLFVSNSASVFGGAISCVDDTSLNNDVLREATGTGTSLSDYVSASLLMTLSESNVTSNNAGSGGGAYVGSGLISISGSDISGNIATVHGGAIYAANIGYLVLANSSSLIGNRAVNGGAGAIYIPPSNIFIDLQSTNLLNNAAVFGNNFASQASQIDLISPTTFSVAPGNPTASLKFAVLDDYGNYILQDPTMTPILTGTFSLATNWSAVSNSTNGNLPNPSLNGPNALQTLSTDGTVSFDGLSVEFAPSNSLIANFSVSFYTNSGPISTLLIINTSSCESGQYLVQGRTCSDCPFGQYGLETNILSCLICPIDNSVDCLGKNTIQSKSNYWVSVVSNELKVAECRGDWCQGNNTCINGHTGEFCGDCDATSGYQFWDGDCTICSGAAGTGNGLFGFVIYLSALFLFSLYSYMNIRELDPISSLDDAVIFFLQTTNTLYQHSTSYNGGTTSSVSSQNDLVNYVETKLNGTEAYSTMLNVLQVASLSISKLTNTCPSFILNLPVLNQMPHVSFYISFWQNILSFPMLLVLVLLIATFQKSLRKLHNTMCTNYPNTPITKMMKYVAAAVNKIVSSVRSKAFAVDEHEAAMTSLTRLNLQEFELDHGSRVIRAWMSCISLVFMPIMNSILKMLHCESAYTDDSGPNLLYNMPAIQCDSDPLYAFHRLLANLILPLFIVFYLGGMTLTLCLAYRNNQLREEMFRRKFGALYAPFQLRFFYWQVALESRKILLSVIVEFLASRPGEMTLSVVSLFCVFLYLESRVKPYRDDLMNKIQQLSYVCLIYIATTLLSAPGRAAQLLVSITVILYLLLAAAMSMIRVAFLRRFFGFCFPFLMPESNQPVALKPSKPDIVPLHAVTIDDPKPSAPELEPTPGSTGPIRRSAQI